MAKQNLLLVDADLRSVRVLEVSLRKAGYNVASAGSGPDALGMLELSRPDLVLCDTRLPTMDGFELIQEMRQRPELAGIPLMILSSDVSVETKVRGLELGVEDYLTKPIYIKELLARVNIVLQRKRREGIEHLEPGHKRKFSGSLSDMGMVDLLQAIDHNKKSGVLYLTSGRFEGAIYFCNGAPVDAAVGRLRGSRAIYRTLLWTEGTFEIDFREIDREDHVQTSMQAVLMEGLRRVDEWGRLLEQLPNLDTVFEVSDTQLIARLAEIPDQINSVLRELDGRRSLWEIVDACDADDLETLSAVSKLYFEGLLYNTGRRPGEASEHEDSAELMSELSDMALPHISSGPPIISHTLAPAWPSVPNGDEAETQLIDDTLQLNIPASPKLPAGFRLTPSQAPKRRKGRKRNKKRSGQSLPAAAEPNRKQQKASRAKADDAEVLEVDETVAEITPSTIAPPPEEAENAAILQPEQAAVPATSVPPKLPRSKPVSEHADFTGGTTTPPELHDHPTRDFAPFRPGATPPPLQSSARPAAQEELAASPALKSTTPPPISTALDSLALHSDDETTETQVSLRTSLPPPRIESSPPRNTGTPPPLPYVSKPPSAMFGSPRGGTSPGFAAAPLDEDTIAAAAAAISEAETAPPPSAATLLSSRGELSRAPEATGDADSASPAAAVEESSPSVPARAQTSPAPYPASMPARDFEAAVLAAASVAPPELRSEPEAFEPSSGASVPPPLAAGESALPSQQPSHDLQAGSDAVGSAAADANASVLAVSPSEADDPARESVAASSAALSGDGASSPLRKLSAAPASESLAPEDTSTLASMRAASEAPHVDAASAPPLDLRAQELAATSMPAPERAEAPAPAAMSVPPDVSASAMDDASIAVAPAAQIDSSASVPPRDSSAPAMDEASIAVAPAAQADSPASIPPHDFTVPALASASVPAAAPDELPQPSSFAESGQVPDAASAPARAYPEMSEANVAASTRPSNDVGPEGAVAPLSPASEPNFAVPALAEASIPPLPREDLPPPAASVAPAKAEEDFSDLGSDERPATQASPSNSPASSRDRASPPPLPSATNQGEQRSSTSPSDYEAASTSMSPRDFSPPALATASIPPSSAEDAALSSAVPPFDDQDAERSRPMSQHARTSPPPLPYAAPRSQRHAEAEPRPFGSPPALATATEPPKGAAALSSPLPPSVDMHTAPGGYVAVVPGASESPAEDDAESNQSAKRIRAPLHRTAVPPPFAPDAAPPLSAADEAARSSHVELGVALATNSDAPRIATVMSSIAPDALLEAEAANDNAVAPAIESRLPPEALAAAAASPSSQRAPKASNVISFVPRKRVDDVVASERSPSVSDAAPSSMSLPARGRGQDVWGSTSGAPGAGPKTSAAPREGLGAHGSDVSSAPSQAAPQPKPKRMSRLAQAGGVAATVALAAGLFALRARDAAPQGSLISALPEVTEPPIAAPAPVGELDTLHKPAAASSQAQQGPAPSAQAAPTTQPPATQAPIAAAPAEKVATVEPAAKPNPEAEHKAAEEHTAAQAAKQPSSGTPTDVVQVLAKGRSLEQKGKKQDALNLYIKAVEDGSASSQVLSRMAFLYLNQGKNALAETHAKSAADADETNSEAWIVLGAAQGQLGKQQAAEQSYRSCADKGQGQYVIECKRMLR